MLTKAPTLLQTWASHFAQAPIPILPQTAEALQVLGQDEDEVTASDLAIPILDDPLMTVKLLSHVAQKRSARVQTGSETVTQALLMMGISRFFREFGDQLTVDQALSAYPAAITGLDRVLRRSHRAATFALAFAVHRKDPDAEVIHEAALTHDFAEALLWCHAPGLALEIQDRQRREPTLRSADVQLAVLNIELCDLEHILLTVWRMPELLIRISDDRALDDRQAQSVMLAIRLARHSIDGWENPALPDDYAAIGQLLSLSPHHVEAKVRALARE
jgi:HD-like signal output (HDOD) protein